MKYIFSLSLFVIISAVIFVNCGQTSGSSRRPVTTIQLLPKKNSYTIGETISVQSQTKLKKSTLDKVEIFLDGNQISESVQADNSFEIKTNDLSVGNHTIKILARNNDGREGENFIKFLVVSDIVPDQYTYKVKATYPHNNQFFTQGLEFHEGILYEGTGQEGRSGIYQVDLKSGKTLKEHKLGNQYFGEGITILNDKIYQISYKNQTGFVYDLKTFELIKTWNFKQKEGWGLTNDGQSIIMSDGTENIYYLNPETLRQEKSIQVTSDKDLVRGINELEYINGEIWANLWTTEKIIRINAKSGKITAEIDLKGITSLLPVTDKDQIDVLNGIAFDKKSGKLYVTGKLWSKLFEIEIIKK